MKKLISARLSGQLLISFLILLTVFHVLILLRVVPYEIVWGGQINDFSSFVILEAVSLLLTLVFIWVISLRINIVKTNKFKRTIQVSVWFIFVYFLLNTIGNFASNVSAEQWIFAPITIVATLLAFRIAIEKD
ncbi:hypothetical protein [Paenibacillus sp. NPDC058071]|uniref:hypothetical protein n=1 Tax=Paenibacillus sp. NPDC058071 TaxID=3346326 RepID=UPI0036DF5DF9